MLTQGSSISGKKNSGRYVRAVVSRLVDNQNHLNSGSQFWLHIGMTCGTF